MTSMRQKKSSVEISEAQLPERFKKRISFGEGDLGLFIEISRNSFSQIVNSRVRNGHHLLLLRLDGNNSREERVVDASGSGTGSFNEARLGGGIVKWNFMAVQRN
ncbi:hypothetical protein CEXT_792801 [Caerostris extrusa]|uniref:Uncharacterized protein n=1 Tax=Caerostris extrusa TaxID=172846 RepID=A0AAV4MJW4_CAEEX|nr:hypothetical protein CEXT_792801 [Caerostris extrusa]